MISSTIASWRALEIMTAFNSDTQQAKNHGIFHGKLQNVALAMAGKIGGANHLLLEKIEPPTLDTNDITGLMVNVRVNGLTPEELLALIQADITADQSDIAAALTENKKLVQLRAGLTPESELQLRQLAIANKALASLTQEQRDAIMATHLLCPIVPPAEGV